MVNNVDKELLVKFSEIIKKYKIDSLNGNEIIESEKDKEILDQVSFLTSQNNEYQVIVNQLLYAQPNEIDNLINNFFENKQENELSEEEEISNLYGVSESSIKRLHLNNGNELFQFYSPDVGKVIVLENGRKGESLLSQLQKYQSLKTEYQTENENNNSKNILMDIRKDSNLELSFYPVSDIRNHQEEIDNLSDDSFRLLQYIMLNATDLDVQLINLENLVYLDSNNNMREVIFDMDHNPSVSIPRGEESDDTNTYNSFVDSPSEASSDIDDMLSNDVVDEDDYSVQEKEAPEEKNNNKVYQLTRDNNQSGFVSNAIVIIGLIVVYFLVVCLFLYLS